MNIAPAIAAVRKAGGAGLNLLLPPGCMACDGAVGGAFQLCAGCFGGYHFITAPFCRGCGVPFTYQSQGGPGGKCPGCLAQAPAFHTARAALAYDTHSRTLILAFKHANRTELARLFAPMMARAGAGLLAQADWLVPVPLHRSRLRQRGYNQAALLARALSRLCHVPTLVDALQRPRKTAPMGHFSAATRSEVMQGAVTSRPARAALIQGRRIVVVDDVMTSGATVNACAEALLASGAARIDVLAIARVPDPELT
jgi:ComF family protein